MIQTSLESNGARLIGTQSGEPANFLLLHAGGERRHVWRPVQDRISRSGFGSIAFDQRGHGESEGSVSDGLETYASDAANMLRANPGARIAVGASLGGMALMLACSDETVRARLSGLVLVDVVPAPATDRVRSFLAHQGETLAASPLVDDILSKATPLQKAIAQFSRPVLLVRAGQKGPMSDEEVSRLRELCPQLNVAHVDAAGHLIARDAPIALADIILNFEYMHRALA